MFAGFNSLLHPPLVVRRDARRAFFLPADQGFPIFWNTA